MDVPTDEFKKARPGFEAKMRRYAPRSIAFLGKRAFSAMFDRPDVEWGQQSIEFAGAIAWILPNPSGLNWAFTLDALVKAYSELGTALRAKPSPRQVRRAPMPSRLLSS